MKKFFSIFLMAAASVATVFAQETEIALPDVTTVISGEALTAGKDSVPDYTTILPERDSPTVQLPVMGDTQKNDSLKKDLASSLVREKDIYAEGRLGAGYPFFFMGDFSVYRASGESPFSINFNHESSEGLAGKHSNEGYFLRNTAVSGEKSFYLPSGTHVISGEYKTSDDGLQFNSEKITDSVSHTIDGGFSSKWNLPKYFSLNYGLNGSWYKRYGEKVKNYDTSLDFDENGLAVLGAESETSEFFINPGLGAEWNYSGFNVFFDADYSAQANLKDSENLQEIEGSSSRNSTHRGQFTLGTKWTSRDENIKLSAQGSILAGTAIGGKDAFFPFKLAAEFKTDSFTDGFIKLSAAGGLDSYQEQVGTLESKYRFAYAPALPSETSDWFGNFDFTVPVKSYLEVSSGFDLRITAFGNGVWAPKYKDDFSSSGLYEICQEKRTDFNTHLNLTYTVSSFKFSGEWKAFWNDTPILTDDHNIIISADYQSTDAKYNAGTSARFAVGEDADNCPDLKLWAEIRIASSLSLAFELNDIVKLCANETRSYGHSKYVGKSGEAVLLVKFQF